VRALPGLLPASPRAPPRQLEVDRLYCTKRSCPSYLTRACPGPFLLRSDPGPGQVGEAGCITVARTVFPTCHRVAIPGPAAGADYPAR
jgi:hypothetical protein